MTVILFAARQLGLTGCAVVAMLVFYEGLPVARQLFAGRVEIAASSAAHAAMSAERAAWQEQQRLADAVREQEHKETQRRIDEADAVLKAGQTEIVARHAALEDILARERAENDRKNGGACRPIMPDGVWRALNEIGD